MSLSPKQQSRLAFAVVIGALAAGMLGAWWLAVRSPRIAFLARDGTPDWIIAPKPPDVLIHKMLGMETVFRRSFNMVERPPVAWLRVRALKRFNVVINGTPVIVPADRVRRWKTPVELDVAEMLRAGTNEIFVTAFNTNGPPALWLSLAAGAFEVHSDTNWDAAFMGAAPSHAWRAADAGQIEPGSLLYGGENTVDSMRHRLPALLLFTVLSTVVVLGGSWLAKKRRLSGGADLLCSWQFGAVAVGVFALAWVALFANNVGQLPKQAGFDVKAHLDYIDFLKTHHALPLATNGWEMCQPPLYYLVSAGLTPHEAEATSDASVQVFRLFGMVVGIAQFTLVYLAARLIFPGQAGKQLLCLALAACVPEQLYLAQYVTNELLAAAWVTGALYFGLRLQRSEKESVWLGAAAGLCLGAGLLTKVTALLAVPFVAGIVAARVVRGGGGIRAWLRLLGTLLLVTFAVGGWHYARVWRHFGTPIVQDWDPVSGFAWWTDNGYQTKAYFLRFGVSLARPFYGVFHSFGDGLYSTLWGDGLCGGQAAMNARPPWNYELMAAGYLLALVPVGLMLSGAVAGLAGFLRRPEAVWFGLLGLAATTFAALVYMNLKLPFFCNVKAFYGLIALLPLCAFGAAGWGLAARSRVVRTLLAIGVGVWAISSYASFWILGGSSVTHQMRGAFYLRDDRVADALREFTEAVRLDPRNAGARSGLAAALDGNNQPGEARKEAEQALQDDPQNVNVRLFLATILGRQGDVTAGIEQARRALELAPDSAVACECLCRNFIATGKYQEALDAGREGLRDTPLSAEMHALTGAALANLGRHAEAVAHLRCACDLDSGRAKAHDQLGLSLAALGRLEEASAEFARASQLQPAEAAYLVHLGDARGKGGNPAEAIQAYRQALKTNPDFLPALNNLAWLLATHPDAQFRDGNEAVRLATRACELTGRKQAQLLGTLAAAYAEAGRFPDAVASANQAIATAEAAGETQLVASNQKLLELYRANRAYREGTP